MTSRGKPAILRVAPSASTVPRYAKLELTVELTATYDNPFDPEQVNLEAEFFTPSQKRIGAPGFFYQPYLNRYRDDDSRRPLLEAVGAPCWKVRFTPVETGEYRYVLRLRNRFGGVDGDVQSPTNRFTATPSNAQGFIRLSKTNNRYFEFDNGRSFVPIGQNLQNDWPIYRHSRLLAENSANCARVWSFCHWTWLEWTSPGSAKPRAEGDWMRSYAGAGRYNQRIAWVFDDCLERWTRDGIAVMLCLGNGTGGGELSADKKGSAAGSWSSHPYNTANGGFLKRPQEFWTDARARRLYQQRLRYIIARWGYSPDIWAFEFWNELGPAEPEMAAWHREMAQYVREIDPNRHLITTSTWNGNVNKFSAIWDLAEMDFVQGHHYGILPALTARIAEHNRRWAKPYLIGEGGGSPASGQEGGKQKVDPESIEFHNSLWAPVLSGAAGTTLPWGWRERIEPRNLFYHYQAVARFVQGVPWTDPRLRPLQLETISSTGGVSSGKFSPVMFGPFGPDFGSKPPRNRFRIEPDGSLRNPEELPGELFGRASSRSQWLNPITFEVAFPEPGQFLVHVREARNSSLELRLDGRPSPLKSPAGSSGPTGTGDFSVEVPAGPHEVTLDNTGADLIRFGYILLTNYRDAERYPDYDVIGRQGDDFAVLWVHNRLHQWPFRAAGFDAGPVGPAMARVAGLKDGRYQIEWWDTAKGAVWRAETADVLNGVLNLLLPALQGDVACKLTRKTVKSGDVQLQQVDSEANR